MTYRERRIKRRLLRELVDENVALLSGGALRPDRGRRGRVGRAVRAALIVVVPAALLGTTLVLSGAVQPGAPGSLLADRPDRTDRTDRADRTDPGPRRPRAEAPGAVAASPDPGSSVGGGGPLASIPLPPPEPVDASVFPLAVRRIVLDPGHGGENLGTRTPGGLEEKFLTLDISRRVEEALVARGFEVLLTRRDDVSVTLQERALMANRKRADIFVSVHVNWLEGSRDSGIETYYLGPTDDPFLTRLAARENRESGHTLAELRDILDGIYAGVRHDKSQDLARAIHRSMVRSLRRVNTGLRDRGVRTAPFLVLVDTEMPAVLAEVAALSNQAEAEMLEKPLYREYIADSLAAGIVAYAESLGGPRASPAPGSVAPRSTTAPPDPPPDGLRTATPAAADAP
jgi:N-acetylmuramoyl-L-alanine amidase